MIDDLFTLSTSRYSKIRAQAQQVIASLVRTLDRSIFVLFEDKLVNFLQDSVDTTHDQLKVSVPGKFNRCLQLKNMNRKLTLFIT